MIFFSAQVKLNFDAAFVVPKKDKRLNHFLSKQGFSFGIHRRGKYIDVDVGPIKDAPFLRSMHLLAMHFHHFPPAYMGPTTTLVRRPPADGS